MPIAAVPDYLGKDFSQASVGLRFGLYLPLWTSRKDQESLVNERSQKGSTEGREVASLLKQKGMDAAISHLQGLQRNPLARLWQKNKADNQAVWNSVTELSPDDKLVLKGLRHRQGKIAEGLPLESLLRLQASSTSPFSTGLGNEHPLENGFAFLNPYGLPYLAGSGVKGVLRKAAKDLASGDWGDNSAWGQGSDTWRPIDALFGVESDTPDSPHLRGALSFWDVLPEIRGDRLAIDVMTPHQGHYYQQSEKENTGKSASPHDSGQPIPVYFLTVPPGSTFTFHVQCDLRHLAHLAPSLVTDARWKTLLQMAFEHAFAWLGFGAKTAVGYGRLDSDARVEQRKQAEKLRQQQARQLRLQEAGIVASKMPWEAAELKETQPGSGDIVVVNPQTSERARGKFYAQLSDADKKRFKNGKKVVLNVLVEQQGNQLLILEIRAS